jgi:glycosyltransferase involved in cell wall biosynthesis
MNDFARLRHSIYRERTGDPVADRQRELFRLGEALFGTGPEESVQKTLFAASLKYSNDYEKIVSSLGDAGTSRFYDRYLADAIASQPGIRPVAEKFVAERSGNPRLKRLTDLIRTGRAGSDKKLFPIGPEALEHPVSLIQCMFHGDPSRSGRGSSGGIGTLLAELGNAMPATAGGVATPVLYDRGRSNYPYLALERYAPNHSIIRLPLSLPAPAPSGFIEGRESITRALVAALTALGIAPQIIHVRFLDDASLAAADAARELGAKLVVTITPDPHRQLCDAEGRIRRYPADTALDFLNKILIGDELLRRAHGVLAIGKNTLEKELMPYYPQLEDTRGRIVAGIDEGVRSQVEDTGLDVPVLLQSGESRYHLSAESLPRPSLLSVGRLAEVKNQVALVGAWSARACRTHNLVLVGGDLENPSEQEQSVIEGIDRLMEGRPELQGRFCHLAGRSNGDIRAIQRFFAERRNAPADLYFCPSLKEEFGLSILEAMAVGMIACAPINGGAKSYIRHGTNGFLVDTRDEKSLAKELKVMLEESPPSPSLARAISENAARTVKTRYSMERIAGEFARFYRRVINE